MTFRFSLQVVLNLKRAQENSQRFKLEAIAAEQGMVRARIQELTGALEGRSRQVGERMSGGLTGVELQFESEHGAKVRLARKRLRMHLDELEKRRVAQLAVVTELRRAREALESLRSQQLEIHRARQLRREQQELDDVFLMRLNRARDE